MSLHVVAPESVERDREHERPSNRRLVLVLLGLLGLASLVGPIVIALGADRGEAAFGDSETFGLNQVASASVSVRVGSTNLPIDTSLLAPGDRVAGRISFENDGTLPLRYALVAELSAGTGPSLLDVLVWQIWPASGRASCSPVPDAQLLFDGVMVDEQVIGDARIGADLGDRVLFEGQEDVLCIEVELPIGIGDAYQSAEAVVDLIVRAEQAPEELP